MTGTKFSEREWAERAGDDKNKFSASEKLEAACWNGILNEMLPEIMEKSSEGKDLFLWQIKKCNSFLQIELSESSTIMERNSSIDPYLFFPALIMS